MQEWRKEKREGDLDVSSNSCWLHSKCLHLPDAEPLMRDGKIRALVATGASRNPILPDVPTLEELGYKGMHMYGWFGMFVHKDTPPDRVEKLSAKINEILAKPSIQEKFRPMGLEIKPISLDAFREMVAKDDAMWEEIAKSVPLE